MFVLKVTSDSVIKKTKGKTTTSAKKAYDTAKTYSTSYDKAKPIIKVTTKVDKANTLFKQVDKFEEQMVIHSINVVNIGSGNTDVIYGKFKKNKKEKYIEDSKYKYETMCEYLSIDGYDIANRSWNELDANEQSAVVENIYAWDTDYFKRSWLRTALKSVSLGFNMVS